MAAAASETTGAAAEREGRFSPAAAATEAAGIRRGNAQRYSVNNSSLSAGEIARRGNCARRATRPRNCCPRSVEGVDEGAVTLSRPEYFGKEEEGDEDEEGGEGVRSMVLLAARLQGAVAVGRGPAVARALTATVRPAGGEWMLARAGPVQVRQDRDRGTAAPLLLYLYFFIRRWYCCTTTAYRYSLFFMLNVMVMVVF